MQSLAERQETFRKQKWPHENSPDFLAQPLTLASAGFYFDPSEEDADNVVCFLCNHALNGWEPTDDPFVEHAQHEPDCPWVLTACLRRRSEHGDRIAELEWDPISEREELVDFLDNYEARKATFGDSWPYDKNKGCSISSSKLAKAGFYYTPEFQDDDTATCVACGYSLGNWELDDDPKTEHRKRTPDCLFFKKAAMKAALTRAKSRKGGKKNAGRGRSKSVSQEPASVPPSSDVESEGLGPHSIKPIKKNNGGRYDLEKETEGFLKTIPECPEKTASQTNSPFRNTKTNTDKDEENNEVTENMPQQKELGKKEWDTMMDVESDGHDQPLPHMVQEPDDAMQEEIVEAQQDTQADTQQTLVTDEPDRGANHNSPTGDVTSLGSINREMKNPPGGNDERRLDIPSTAYSWSGQSVSTGELKSKWDLTDSELDMTVEEFIRHCADIRLQQLQAVGSNMIERFLQRAETTRKMVSSIQ